MTLSIWSAAREAPETPALIGAGGSVSYRALAGLSGRALGWLQARRAHERQPVALIAASDLPSVAMLQALIGSGVAALLVHPRLTAGEQSALLDAARPGLVVDSDWSAAQSAPEPAPIPDDDRPLAIVYTSGTAQQPKGVVLGRRAVVAAARASAHNLGWLPDDRWLLALPLAHIGGLSVLTRCLLARRTIVLAEPRPAGGRVGARRVAELVDAHRVTLVSLVPTQLAGLLDLRPSWTPPPALRAILLGGAAAPRPLLERAADRGWPVLTTYGLTEACSQVATQRLGTINRGELGVGFPVEGMELRISAGSVQIRGPMLFSGYRGAGGPAVGPDGWFDTGDLGRLDADGALHLQGRRDDLIVTGGENVSPAEVEAALELHPDIAECCVFGVPDPIWGQLVAAALVLRPNRSLDSSELDGWAGRQLASFKRPRRWCVLPSLPRHASGKLDRAGAAAAATCAGLWRP